MIQLFKKKPAITPEKNCVYAPVAGFVKPLSEVNDMMFSQEALGKGIAIEPEGDIIYAPISGKVAVATSSCHAVAIVSQDGMEVLIHIGLNTVELAGKFFKIFVEKDQEVQAGQKLVEFNRKKVQEAGYDIITLVIITNTHDYEDVNTITGRSVSELEKIIEVK